MAHFQITQGGSLGSLSANKGAGLGQLIHFLQLLTAPYPREQHSGQLETVVKYCVGEFEGANIDHRSTSLTGVKNPGDVHTPGLLVENSRNPLWQHIQYLSTSEYRA